MESVQKVTWSSLISSSSNKSLYKRNAVTAPDSSSLGIDTRFIGARRDLPITNEQVILPYTSTNLWYADVPYPSSDPILKKCNLALCMSPNHCGLKQRFCKCDKVPNQVCHSAWCTCGISSSHRSFFLHRCWTMVFARSVTSIDAAFKQLATTLQEGFNLPKPEMLTFNGTPTDYCKFIKNFETNIENSISDNRLRLSYLIQYYNGEAKSSIEDCVLLEPSDGYKRARSILYSRYGRPHVVARSYIDKLVNGPQLKASDIDGLSRLALEMQKCEITLSQLGFSSDVDNSETHCQTLTDASEIKMGRCCVFNQWALLEGWTLGGSRKICWWKVTCC